MNNEIQSMVKQVTDKIIIDMEKNEGKWMRGWVNHKFQNIDGHRYTGFNILWLALQPFKRGIYGTYLQWQKEGCQVNKGSKATKLLLYRPYMKDVTNKAGEVEQKTFRLLRTFNVFNIENVKGNISKWDGVDNFNGINEVKKSINADNFVKNLKANIEHSGGVACFIPSKDLIKMPEQKDFINTEDSTATENYYCTLFHELTHWTGADNRLKRSLSGFFGSPSYAFEELVAELGSAYVSNSLDITASPRPDHAKYLKSWIKCLKDKPEALLKASGLANKALTFMNSKQPNKEVFKKVA